jgi:hypothetical protein
MCRMFSKRCGIWTRRRTPPSHDRPPGWRGGRVRRRVSGSSGDCAPWSCRVSPPLSCAATDGVASDAPAGATRPERLPGLWFAPSPRVWERRCRRPRDMPRRVLPRTSSAYALRGGGSSANIKDGSASSGLKGTAVAPPHDLDQGTVARSSWYRVVTACRISNPQAPLRPRTGRDRALLCERPQRGSRSAA